MFFNDDEDRSLSPEMWHCVSRNFYSYSSNLDLSPYCVPSVPTHTEDGIPIRKLFVSNLPPKTTRSELFGIFAQYGFIKSCWLKMSDKGINNKPSASIFAFVTYSNPADAHRALLAPHHEKVLRGRSLKISPADSWHQPADDSNRVLPTKPSGTHGTNENSTPVSSNNNLDEDAITNRDTSDANGPDDETPNTETNPVPEQDEGISNTILEVLNMDCLTYILDYIPIRDLMLSERVSKGWQDMIHQYFSNVRMFKTSWWPHNPVALTTAVLRRVLQRLGGSLIRLHIDHLWSVLNDRTAHTIGKFCPHLEELQVVGMHTKNWNPLMYGCKNLKRISFISCSKLTDSSLEQIMKNESNIESVTVGNNSHVTGLFLTSSNNMKINSLAFSNCFKIQPSLLCAVASSLTNLTTLVLHASTTAMWKGMPSILKKLPKLQELTLSEFTADRIILNEKTDSFPEAVGTLTRLKKLNLSKNARITNAMLQQIAELSPNLEYLNVSGCNSGTGMLNTGVGDDAVAAICRSCTLLQRLDVSYLTGLTDAGLRNIGLLTCLTHLKARGNSALTSAALTPCLTSCNRLEELDVCGCEGVSIEETCAAAVTALTVNPHLLVLRLAGTTPMLPEHELPFHKLLLVDIYDEHSQNHMKTDYTDDSIYDDSTGDDSLDGMINHEDYFIDDPVDLFEDLLELISHAPELIIV